jgi:porin
MAQGPHTAIVGVSSTMRPLTLRVAITTALLFALTERSRGDESAFTPPATATHGAVEFTVTDDMNLATDCSSAQPAETVGDHYLATEESVHSHPTVMDAWFNGKAEVYTSDGLFAQLAGDLRRDIADRGVIPYGWSMTALQGNPVGGLDQDFQYTNLTDYGLDFDLETLAGIKGLSARVSGSSTSGNDLSVDVGTTIPVNTVFSGQSLRFYEMYLEQEWMDEQLNLRIGRLTVGWEYGLDYDFFTQYLSGAYRLNVFSLGGNTPNFSLIPFANWGARLRWTPTTNWKFQASFMNGFPRDFGDDDEHGLEWDFRPDEGAFFIAEATYQWSATDEQRRGSGCLPGRIMGGVYFDTGEFDFVDGSDNASHGLGSVYTIGEQKLWEPEALSDRGLHVWIAAVNAWKEELVTVPWFVNGGLVWFGPADSRQNDRLALGFANAWFSDALPGQTTESVLSSSYTFHINDVLEITPDLQYILQPSGMSSIDNALLLGVLFYVTL